MQFLLTYAYLYIGLYDFLAAVLQILPKTFAIYFTLLARRCFKAIPTARLLIIISKPYSMSSKVFIIIIFCVI
jgi:hypothetical protein